MSDTIAWDKAGNVVESVVERGVAHGWTHHCTQPQQGHLVILHKDNPNGGVKKLKLNIWCTTGTVGSYLKHPKQGNKQLFRKDIETWTELEAILKNPRVHTNKGYHRKEAAPPRTIQVSSSAVPKPKVTSNRAPPTPHSGEAAAATTMRGSVRFFDARKRFFGFITAADGRDVYVHRNNVRKGHRLYPGCSVEFVVVTMPRGPQARKVRVV